MDFKLDTNSIKKRYIVNDPIQYIDSIECLNVTDIVLPQPDNIVAIGDIHGDFDGLIYCLYIAHVIDENGNWNCENTYVVQLGDIFDDCRPTEMNRCRKIPGITGYDEIMILKYLSELNAQAQEHNGKVLLCIGNHEFMAVRNKDAYSRYVSPTIKKVFKERENVLKPGGILSKKLACMMNLVVFLGNWVFLHGGLVNSFIKDMNNLIKLNNNMKRFLNGEDISNQESEIYKDINKLNTDESPLLSRTYSLEECESCPKRCIDELQNLRTSLGIPNLRMVIGHTPQLKGINSICKIDEEQIVYRVDAGISWAFGEKFHTSERIEVLIIKGNKAIHVDDRNFTTNFLVS